MASMKQQYKIEDTRFLSKEITYDTGGIFTDPALFLNNKRLNVNSGNCYITSDDGLELLVTFNKRFMDRYPSVVIGEIEHTVLNPLSWLQKLALLFPFILVLTNAFLGLIAAIGLWIYNSKIFRKKESSLLQSVFYIVPLSIVFIGLQLTSYFLASNFSTIEHGEWHSSNFDVRIKYDKNNWSLAGTKDTKEDMLFAIVDKVDGSTFLVRSEHLDDALSYDDVEIEDVMVEELIPSWN